jgi:HAD superfamily hydrolase (TIGR01509 family)
MERGKNMGVKKKLVIFDMDGLLLDTERIYSICWKQTFIECGVTIDHSEMEKLIGVGLEELKRRLSNILNGEEEFHRLRNYRETIFWKYIDEHGLPIKKGSLEMLALLRKNGVPTALASSTYQKRAQKLLETAKLTHQFDYEIFGDQVTNTKPHPDLFNQIITMSGFDKEQCIVFEDSYNGIKASNNAGIEVVWIKDLVEIGGLSDINFVASFDSLEAAIPFIESQISDEK